MAGLRPVFVEQAYCLQRPYEEPGAVLAHGDMLLIKKLQSTWETREVEAKALQGRRALRTQGHVSHSRLLAHMGLVLLS